MPPEPAGRSTEAASQMFTVPPMEDVFEEGLELVEDAIGVRRRVEGLTGWPR